MSKENKPSALRPQRPHPDDVAFLKRVFTPERIRELEEQNKRIKPAIDQLHNSPHVQRQIESLREKFGYATPGQEPEQKPAAEQQQEPVAEQPRPSKHAGGPPPLEILRFDTCYAGLVEARKTNPALRGTPPTRKAVDYMYDALKNNGTALKKNQRRTLKRRIEKADKASKCRI
jgi:hypothetical protein